MAEVKYRGLSSYSTDFVPKMKRLLMEYHCLVSSKFRPIDVPPGSIEPRHSFGILCSIAYKVRKTRELLEPFGVINGFISSPRRLINSPSLGDVSLSSAKTFSGSSNTGFRILIDRVWEKNEVLVADDWNSGFIVDILSMTKILLQANLHFDEIREICYNI